MKRIFPRIYAAAYTLFMAAGAVLVFCLAWRHSPWSALDAVIGMAESLIVAPLLHEGGHVLFAAANGMRCVYFKCFCVKSYYKDGKRKCGFASPFSPDQTQVLPKHGGAMQKRARAYAVGGLVMGGLWLLILLAAAITVTLLGGAPYALWGNLPYAAYLFFLNLLPAEYASGKTDALVARGIKKGEPAEQNLVAAMEIQGELYVGKTFAEIDEKFYFDVPQLCEDEPLFAVMLDLRYRYYLDKGDFAKAAACINRLAQAQAYLPDVEIEKIAAELTYLYAVNDDLESAEESGKLCRNFLKSETPTAKRILAAYSLSVGQPEHALALKAQAEAVADGELLLGVYRFETKLLARLPWEQGETEV